MSSMGESYKAITKDSKSKKDFKKVNTTTFDDFAKKKNHIEFLCKLHMKDRLLNYCHQDNLVDVIFSGLEYLKFSRVEMGLMSCRHPRCIIGAEYRIDRFD